MTFALLSGRQGARWNRPEPVNIVIVMVDTLRADHMSTYGYERATTPFINEFASRIVFEHARSQASCTFPSVNSLLTSRNPAIFTRQEADQLGIPDAYPSIAEILSEHGYFHHRGLGEPDRPRYTNQLQSKRWFRPRPRYLYRGDSAVPRGSGQPRHQQKLDAVEEPFFYAHFMEPHAHQPPKR